MSVVGTFVPSCYSRGYLSDGRTAIQSATCLRCPQFDEVAPEGIFRKVSILFSSVQLRPRPYICPGRVSAEVGAACLRFTAARR